MHARDYRVGIAEFGMPPLPKRPIQGAFLAL